MYLLFPFIYYSGITGWNGYLYYSRGFTSMIFDGNSAEYDLSFSAGDGLDIRYSKGVELSQFQIRFLNVQVNYFHPDEFYTIMGGVYGRWGKFFLGIDSNWKPSVDVLLHKSFRRGKYGLRLRGMGRYYGGYPVPLSRMDAWGYRRNEIRNPVAYSITIMGSYRLMEQVLYAGFMPVGKRGVDLLAGVQLFEGHISLGVGIRLLYPVIGSFHVLAGMEPASGRWDIFVGLGDF